MQIKPIEIGGVDYPNQNVSFSIDPMALIDIDSFIQSGLYKNRSSFFRDAVYEHICIIKNQIMRSENEKKKA